MQSHASSHCRFSSICSRAFSTSSRHCCVLCSTYFYNRLSNTTCEFKWEALNSHVSVVVGADGITTLSRSWRSGSTFSGSSSISSRCIGWGCSFSTLKEACISGLFLELCGFSSIRSTSICSISSSCFGTSSSIACHFTLICEDAVWSEEEVPEWEGLICKRLWFSLLNHLS